MGPRRHPESHPHPAHGRPLPLPPPPALPAPPIVWLAAAFFAVAGALGIGLSLWDAPQPLSFVRVWETVGRGLLHFLVAWGLWQRLALCRTVAMVYCLASVTVYAAALVLAFVDAPLRFPPSVVVQSLYEVPSCVLLFPALRSARAALAFPAACSDAPAQRGAPAPRPSPTRHARAVDAFPVHRAADAFPVSDPRNSPKVGHLFPPGTAPIIGHVERCAQAQWKWADGTWWYIAAGSRAVAPAEPRRVPSRP